MTVTVDMVKCACADCVCVVSTGNAVAADNRLFCGDACATPPHPPGAPRRRGRRAPVPPPPAGRALCGC